MRLTSVPFISASALVMVACFEAPPPLWHQLAEDEDPGGGGGGNGGAFVGGAGDGGAGAGGEGGVLPPLPVCQAGNTDDCARAERIFAGGHHTCVSMTDGTLRCWGSNESLQLGNPEEPQGLFAGPVVVDSLRDPSQVALGKKHSCAIAADGAVWCWGSNQWGQLGTGDDVFRAAPVRVLDDARAIAASDTTCAVLDTSDVSCWGVLLNGQGWAYDNAASSSLPSIWTGPAVSTLALGSRHGCAITMDGVVCWGTGEYGQLGDGERVDHTVPTPVTDALLQPVHQIAAGSSRTCVLAGTPAQIQCWGSRPLVGIVDEPTALPVQPSGDVEALGVGYNHSCALLTDGRVACWGQNHDGLLGAAGGDSTEPVEVQGLDDAMQLAVGGSHSCVIRGDDSVVCWGDNHFGQLGPAGPWSAEPVTVSLEVTP